MLGSWDETKRVLKAAPVFFGYLMKTLSKK
jgi:hypothetical protein